MAKAIRTKELARTLPEPSPLVPRRAQGTAGNRSPTYPDLNYQVIGAALGISSTFLGRILGGRSRPSMELASRLASYMGWTLDQVNSLYKPKLKIAVAQKEESDGKSRNRRNRPRKG